MHRFLYLAISKQASRSYIFVVLLSYEKVINAAVSVLKTSHLIICINPAVEVQLFQIIRFRKDNLHTALPLKTY
eukprot:snap_masked-scaffold_25-processed-gene-3.38-mRNA-1 protein AED:1.00 eAED:1.00 QI:0/0/0/0/1/1/3/0/73